MVSFTHMTATDVRAVVDFMARYPELAFERWEDESLLTRTIAAHPGRSLVARLDGSGDIVGALIGGVFCGRATISHVGMLPEYRRLRHGRRLVAHALSSYRDAGAKRCHILVTVDNIPGRKFWRDTMQFAPPEELVTLELDVPGDAGSRSPSIESLNTRNADEVRELFAAHAPDELSHVESLLQISQLNGRSTGACFLTRSGGSITGASVVGSYGVRGVLHRVVHTNGSSSARGLVNAALSWLRDHHVLRVHAFVGKNGDPQLPLLTDAGFTDRSYEMMEIAL